MTGSSPKTSKHSTKPAEAAPPHPVSFLFTHPSIDRSIDLLYLASVKFAFFKYLSLVEASPLPGEKTSLRLAVTSRGETGAESSSYPTL